MRKLAFYVKLIKDFITLSYMNNVKCKMPVKGGKTQSSGHVGQTINIEMMIEENPM